MERQHFHGISIKTLALKYKLFYSLVLILRSVYFARAKGHLWKRNFHNKREKKETFVFLSLSFGENVLMYIWIVNTVHCMQCLRDNKSKVAESHPGRNLFKVFFYFNLPHKRNNDIWMFIFLLRFSSTATN